MKRKEKLFLIIWLVSMIISVTIHFHGVLTHNYSLEIIGFGLVCFCALILIIKAMHDFIKVSTG